jgi:hypothetical protein
MIKNEPSVLPVVILSRSIELHDLSGIGGCSAIGAIDDGHLLL